MGRTRVYANAAERQKAHRERHRQACTEPFAQTAPASRLRRAPSRPARLAALVEGAEALLEEYRDWLDRLPEAFEGTTLHELLTETVERLETAVESLEGIDPPRGFGRD